MSGNVDQLFSHFFGVSVFRQSHQMRIASPHDRVAPVSTLQGACQRHGKP
jgi:hypothetical protein